MPAEHDVNVPPETDVRIVENTAETVNFVMPPDPNALLADEDTPRSPAACKPSRDRVLLHRLHPVLQLTRAARRFPVQGRGAAGGPRRRPVVRPRFGDARKPRPTRVGPSGPRENAGSRRGAATPRSRGRRAAARSGPGRPGADSIYDPGNATKEVAMISVDSLAGSATDSGNVRQFVDFTAQYRENPALRARADEEPRAVLAEHDIDVPAGTDVRIVENTAETFNFIVPPDPNAVLADEDLSTVSGGGNRSGQQRCASSFISCIMSFSCD